MKKYEFDAVMQKNEELNSGYIEFPYSVEEEFGMKGQVKVKAYFDGFLYRGSLVKMGHSCHLIGVNKEVRNAIQKNPGDMVHVVIERDTEERTVQLPDDFIARLNEEPEAKGFFEKLSYSHQREYIQWIESAKKEETRQRRISQAMEMLKEKKAKVNHLTPTRPLDATPSLGNNIL